MKIGFTGTRCGLTSEQKKTLSALLEKFESTEFHHGDCIGADEEAATLAHKNKFKIITHPPKNSSLRANVTCSDVIVEKKEYMERNIDIVESSDILFATPNTKREILKSGTWATVRYARKLSRPIIIILPDGRIKEEGI